MTAGIARVVAIAVVVVAGCGGTGGDSEALSDKWLAFDPCELGDTAAIASLLDVKQVATEIIETTSLFGDRDVIVGKTCVFDAGGIGAALNIWFGQGSGSLNRGGRLIELPGVGDEAGMTVNDGEHSPEREGEILGVVVNVAGMTVIVLPPSGATPLEGSPEADQFVEISRAAADRMRTAVQTG